MNAPENIKPQPALVFVGLGSNIEPRAESISKAVAMIEKLPGVNNMRRSSLYETAAVNMSDQSGAFLNGVVSFETLHNPDELLDTLQSIERQLGRINKGNYCARTIDLDLLLFGSLVQEVEHLVLPHPGLTKRLFVLEPLLELQPDCIDPSSGLPLKQFFDNLLMNENSNENQPQHSSPAAR